jgi:hypothetical protein
LVFDRVVTRKTPGEFRTRVIQDGVHPSPHIDYKNFDLKQYFKEGRGCRTEGTFRNPNDFAVNNGLANLPYLQKLGRQINRRLLEVERVSRNSGLTSRINDACCFNNLQPILATLTSPLGQEEILSGFGNRGSRRGPAEIQLWM